MLRGRILAINGVRAEEIKAASDAEWVLESDRGITYANEVPANSRLAEGQWWPNDYSGPPLVSFDKKLADGLGLKIGDRITVNVLGRSVDVTLANTRVLDWQSLGINFVMVFSPNTFRGAPHTSSRRFPDDDHSPQRDAEIVKTVASCLPDRHRAYACATRSRPSAAW